MYYLEILKNGKWSRINGPVGTANNAEMGAQLINTGISFGMCYGIENFRIIENDEFGACEVFNFNLDSDYLPVNSLDDLCRYIPANTHTMPEISNIKECMEEFFEYAESCGVGALL